MEPENQEPLSFGCFECEVCRATMEAVLVDHTEDDGYDHDLYYRCPQCKHEKVAGDDVESAIGWILIALRKLM